MRQRPCFSFVSFFSFLSFSSFFSFPAQAQRAPDDLDQFIRAQMSRRHIPGLSIAVIQDGRIVTARAYGVTEAGGTTPVTTSTLFQAGSISKSVAALGALRLVEQGQLDLDSNVNNRLTTWKVPDNGFTAARKVTLRGLLSHTAGLTVHGFPGYAVSERMPTLVQVLDGAGNTPAIRVDTAPGSLWRYSGGGYTVMQQLMIDVTHRPFPDFMREAVLQPLGMTASSYEQPLGAAMQRATATGHYQDRSKVAGRWHVYPEMAAAGLWTTPSDLARFAIGVQQALAGTATPVISQAMARRMVTVERDGDGLGVFIGGAGRGLNFSHNGRDEGFDAVMVATQETGHGVIVMINANDDSRMMGAITGFVARKYGFPDAPPPPPSRTAARVPAALLRSLAGRYEFQNNQMIEIAANDTVIQVLRGGFPDEDYFPQDTARFLAGTRDIEMGIVRDAAGAVTHLTLRQPNGQVRRIPRIGSLVAQLPRRPDADPANTARVRGALVAMGRGGEAMLRNADITDGAKHDFGAQPVADLAGAAEMRFIARDSVAGRGIMRHGSPVATIIYLEYSNNTGRHYVMAHVTPEGMVTDYDFVDN